MFDIGESMYKDIIALFTRKLAKHTVLFPGSTHGNPCKYPACLSSSSPGPRMPMRPPNDLNAKMEATLLMSSCTRSRRSMRVGPRTESASPQHT